MDKLIIAAMVAVSLYAVGACDRSTESDRANPAAPPSAQSPSIRPGQPSTSSSQIAQLSFDAVDANKDGVITHDEALTVRGLDFAAADTDNSLTLSRQEFAVAMATLPRG
jgi:hypothetical protein